MRRSRHNHAASVDRLLNDGDTSGFTNEIVELVENLRTESERFGTPTDLATTLATEARQIDSAEPGPRTRTPRPLPKRWRRRIMLSTFLSSLAGKLAIGSVALATTTGGLAATGNLPDPVQDWAAERLGTVGVEIPSGIQNDVEINSEHNTADDVLGVIDGTEPQDRDQAFGEDVADTASTDGLDRAEDGADNAGEFGDIADEKTEDVPTGVDDVELPEEADASQDQLPEESESGAENAEQGDAFRP